MPHLTMPRSASYNHSWWLKKLTGRLWKTQFVERRDSWLRFLKEIEVMGCIFMPLLLLLFKKKENVSTIACLLHHKPTILIPYEYYDVIAASAMAESHQQLTLSLIVPVYLSLPVFSARLTWVLGISQRWGLMMWSSPSALGEFDFICHVLNVIMFMYLVQSRRHASQQSK